MVVEGIVKEHWEILKGYNLSILSIISIISISSILYYSLNPYSAFQGLGGVYGVSRYILSFQSSLKASTREGLDIN